jgi:hypothetical protein
MSASVWREFSRLGHWIEPAVLLRWADETSRMSKGECQPALSLISFCATSMPAAR